MADENKTAATFEWRITHYKHADLHTLMGWSNVKKHDELPPEYTRFHGPRFWEDGEDVLFLLGMPSTTGIPGHRTVHRGAVLEEGECEAAIAHLGAAAKNLQLVNETIKYHSETKTIEV